MNRWQKERVDEQTITFMNLIENFSKNEDDLINILDRANQYMPDPIYTIMNRFVMEARLSADMEVALKKVRNQLQGTKIESVLDMLYLCSLHDSNYYEVIRDAKMTVKEYMKSKSIRKAILNSARVDVFALFIGAAFVVMILNEFLSMSVWNILSSGYIGIAIVLYCIGVVGGAAYYLFWR